MTLVPVIFIAKHSIYNAGEVAGFHPDEAAKLVERKRAVYYEQPREETVSADEAQPETLMDELHAIDPQGGTREECAERLSMTLRKRTRKAKE